MGIRFGLAAIKNVGDAAIDTLLMERGTGGPFHSLFDFCQRVDLRKVNRRVIESLIKCGAFDVSKTHRSQMLTSLDEALTRSQQIQKRKGEAQMSMFASSVKEESPYPELEEFPEKQLITFEKETIGFYFSQHPLSRYREVVQRVTQEDSSTLAELPNGSEVKICGLVSTMKEITTKKGDRMAFVTLEDMKGFVEAILFPEVFKASLTLLRSGEPIILRGTLDLSDEQAGETRIGQQTKAKIIGREVEALPEPSAQPTRTLRIKMPFDLLNLERLEDLKTVILAHRGDAQLVLHLIDGTKEDTVIALSDRYRVDCSLAFQADVKKLFESCTISFG